MPALTHLPAVEIARLVAERQISCTEVVEAHLARIEALNKELNAVTVVLDGPAQAEAAGLDARIAAGEPLGPLTGVPFSVKENIDVAGLPTTWGVPALADAVPPQDAPAVERMRAAGAILVARTNLPDMALRAHTDSSLHGLTRNPWNLTRTAGGSSGGEAVALATGMSAMGLGTDLGGSLRNPATCCGVTSIRPTFGRVAQAGTFPSEDPLLYSQLMSVHGPLGRRVADVRAALAVVSGAHPRDPWSVTVPIDAPAHPVRVALVTDPPGGSTDPVVASAVRAAAGALDEAGYIIEEVNPPRYEEAATTWTRFVVTDVASALPRIRAIMGPAGLSFLDAIVARVPPLDAAGFSAVMSTRLSIARAWSLFFADYALVLSPTWTQLPFEIGADESPEGALAALELFRPVLPANLMGLPSVCVPAALDTPTGLPIGVLLTGARYTEATCLDAAAVIEGKSPITTPIDPA